MIVTERQATLEAINEFQRNEARKNSRKARHIGPSFVGHPCDRYIWFKFRSVMEEDIDPRMQRVFARGSREEAVIVRYLKSVGVDIRATGSKQITVTPSKWMKGHPDGIIVSGLKESPSHKHIAEFKTSNYRGFASLVRDGVQKAKPMHYAQMQVYMYATGIERAFYMVINKNDDDIYTERVKLDAQYAKSLVAKADTLATEPNMPNGCNDFHCNMCEYKAYCKGDEKMHINKWCRTCEACEFHADGNVYCQIDEKKISFPGQQKPCTCWELQYDLRGLSDEA